MMLDRKKKRISSDLLLINAIREVLGLAPITQGRKDQRRRG